MFAGSKNPCPMIDATLALKTVRDAHAKNTLPVARLFTTAGRHPFDEVEWDKRTIVIRGMNGGAHEERDCEFPVFWSPNASNITGSKYFRGRVGSDTRERSVRQLIGRGADSGAGMIASGGSTRRAAKMVVLDADHPDIMQYVTCKAEEEKKVRALMAAGYPMQDLNHEAWKSIQYKNANNSVRVTDAFMRAVEEDGAWRTRFVTSGEVAEEMKARDLFRAIAEAAHASGDPGLQFDTTINDWNTAANAGRINATNPCAEYIHLDNSASNLASINLLQFLNEDGSFRVEDFLHTVRVMILAQEIMVDGSSYPTPKISENAHDFRELGLGYANLGAFLMALGIPYDSKEGTAAAGAITALMTGEAYRYSSVVAARMHPFPGNERGD